MCFSASVSYGTAALLVGTGLYTLQRARGGGAPYQVLAWVPLFFGIQQAFEGRVWQAVEAGEAASAVPYALGFLFFSHFLWLWWIPLSSYLLEHERIRKRLFLGITLFGFAAGSLVYFTLLFNADWLAVEVENRHIVYDVTSPYRGPFTLGIPPSVLYGVIILVPLLFSSQRGMRRFGGLVALSAAVASLAYGYAFVSVWCFFAAALSLYLAHLIRWLGAEQVERLA